VLSIRIIPIFEYIIIDGGSTDGSVQLIQEKQDIFGDNFLWKSEPDSGYIPCHE
jgi:glycosyltransferase involved in cell wall biosynthesis